MYPFGPLLILKSTWTLHLVLFSELPTNRLELPPPRRFKERGAGLGDAHQARGQRPHGAAGAHGVLGDAVALAVVGVDGGRGERVLRVPPAAPQELRADILRPRHQERGGVRRVLLPVEERLQGGGQELQEYLQLRGGGSGGAGMFDCGGGNDEAVSQIYDIYVLQPPFPHFGPSVHLARSH